MIEQCVFTKTNCSLQSESYNSITYVTTDCYNCSLIIVCEDTFTFAVILEKFGNIIRLAIFVLKIRVCDSALGNLILCCSTVIPEYLIKNTKSFSFCFTNVTLPKQHYTFVNSLFILILVLKVSLFRLFWCIFCERFVCASSFVVLGI